MGMHLTERLLVHLADFQLAFRLKTESGCWGVVWIPLGNWTQLTRWTGRQNRSWRNLKAVSLPSKESLAHSQSAECSLHLPGSHCTCPSSSSLHTFQLGVDTDAPLPTALLTADSRTESKPAPERWTGVLTHFLMGLFLSPHRSPKASQVRHTWPAPPPTSAAGTATPSCSQEFHRQQALHCGPARKVDNWLTTQKTTQSDPHWDWFQVH